VVSVVVSVPAAGGHHPTPSSPTAISGSARPSPADYERGRRMPIRGEGEVSRPLTAMAPPSLPEARAEGEAIAGRFADALLLTGTEATKSALGQVGGDGQVLLAATHGYAVPDFPDCSGPLLAARAGAGTPYQVLTAGEMYGWPLNASLATLSACQTALGQDVEGEGILGLSRAFIWAGGQDVVCSLRPVLDESTRTLLTAFQEALDARARSRRRCRRARTPSRTAATGATRPGGRLHRGARAPVAAERSLRVIVTRRGRGIQACAGPRTSPQSAR